MAARARGGPVRAVGHSEVDGTVAGYGDVDPKVLEWSGHASGVELAADAAAWSAVRSSAPRFAGEALLSAVDCWLEILQPLVDAYEAGLWLFWVLEREVVAVARPALRIEEGRLRGPAVF